MSIAVSLPVVDRDLSAFVASESSIEKLVECSAAIHSHATIKLCRIKMELLQ
jgi:hypothetical protein